jgi:hypothetical protein
MEEDEILQKYNELLNKYEKLVEECKDNVVLESMNEMKTKYDNMLKNTVPTYKYNALTKKYEVAYTTLISCGVIIDHVSKVIKGLDNRYDRSKVLQAQLELVMLRDIIDESFREV